MAAKFPTLAWGKIFAEVGNLHLQKTFHACQKDYSVGMHVFCLK